VGTGFEFMRPHDAPSHFRFSLGLALQPTEFLHLGVGYHYISSDERDGLDGTHSVDFGLLIRPTWWVSLGITASDLNTPKIDGVVVPRAYGFAAAFRPGTEKVVLEVGAEIEEDDADVQAIARLRSMPVDGFEFGIRAALSPNGDDVDVDLGVSLGFHFGAASLEGAAFTSRKAGRDLGFDGFSVGVRFGQKPLGRLLKRGDKTVVVSLGNLPEEPREGLLGGRNAVFLDVMRYLDRLAKDERISGVLLRDIGSSPGWAQAEEIRARITDLRAAGKRVIAYLDQGDLRHLYIYSAADHIVVNPAGGLRLTGLKFVVTYYKQALDHLRVTTQWVKQAEYKSAPESFSRTGPSEPAQRARNGLLDSMWSTLTKGIEQGRKLPTGTAAKLIDDGPYIASECKRLGLVDDVAFYDEVTKVVSQTTGIPMRLGTPTGLQTARERWAPHPTVAVIVVEGNIVDGKSRRVPILGTKNVGDKTIIAAIEAAARNPKYAGILVRVNSPGGSSFASDAMHRALKLASKLKPVVVSFGNVAASGGYYLAMGGQEVFATDLTVTGSIGVFLGKPAFNRLFRWLGIGRHIDKRGKKADLFGIDVPWTEEELVFLRDKVKSFYDLFVSRVADNRKMSTEAVDKVARGRVWMGREARENGLIDTRGGMLDALNRVKSLAGIDTNAPIRTEFLPRANLSQRLKNTLGLQIQALLAEFPEARDSIALAFPFIAGFKPGEALALMPYHLTIE
jgi:protease-4